MALHVAPSTALAVSLKAPVRGLSLDPGPAGLCRASVKGWVPVSMVSPLGLMPAFGEPKSGRGENGRVMRELEGPCQWRAMREGCLPKLGPEGR